MKTLRTVIIIVTTTVCIATLDYLHTKNKIEIMIAELELFGTN